MKSETLVVMCDDRKPLFSTFASAPFYSLAAVLNMAYCRRHGYDFHYFLLDGSTTAVRSGAALSVDICKEDSLPRVLFDALNGAVQQCFVNSAGLGLWNRLTWRLARNVVRRPVAATGTHGCCAHTGYGARAASWAKLLCIGHALRTQRYRKVCYIDSDAIFSRFDQRLEDFVGSSAGQQTALVLPFNYPWLKELVGEELGRNANAGFMVWDNTPTSQELLEFWWNSDAGKFHYEHDWEQFALDRYVLPEFAGHIKVLPLVTMKESPGQFIRHVAGPESWLRLPRFRWALFKHGLWRDFPRQIERLRTSHLYVFGTASGQ